MEKETETEREKERETEKETRGKRRGTEKETETKREKRGRQRRRRRQRGKRRGRQRRRRRQRGRRRRDGDREETEKKTEKETEKKTEKMAERPALAGDVGLQDVLRGRGTDGDQRTKSNMIRVFISSTFSDMSSERKALLDNAYPEVLAFCRSRGLVFEVVDLRWGIRSVPSGDHEGLLGNRYGERTLPRRVPETLFQLLLSKLSKNREGAALLTRWFLRDDNAVPPAYVLQPITAHRPPDAAAALGWRDAETTLLQLLRSAATAGGGVTAEQKQELLTSGRTGSYGGDIKHGESKICFGKNIPRQRARDGPRRLARLLDLGGGAGGVLDAEARRLLGALREGLLGKLCCAIWESTNVHHGPLVVHGAAGAGKTALLCRLAAEVRGVLVAGATVVVRLLAARHPHRPDVHQVSRRGGTLLIVLDAVDHLSDRHVAHKLRWLPAVLPPNVHLLVSMDTDSEAFANMRLNCNNL
ncbi:hypothetical protein FQN60_005335, partial [Etheostoma spectabile]